MGPDAGIARAARPPGRRARRMALSGRDGLGALPAALLALVCHLLFETTVWPASTGQWLAVIVLGIGPAGGAFFLWDIGVKRGDIRALGALSYAAPVLSTLLLVVFGRATLSAALIAAIGRGLGRGAVHELTHQLLPKAPIHATRDPRSYEYRSAARPEQFFGDLRWDLARPLLQARFGW